MANPGFGQLCVASANGRAEELYVCAAQNLKPTLSVKHADIPSTPCGRPRPLRVASAHSRFGSFVSCAVCRLPGSSGHPSSLSERNGLQAPHTSAFVTVEAPWQRTSSVALASGSTTDRRTADTGIARWASTCHHGIGRYGPIASIPPLTRWANRDPIEARPLCVAQGSAMLKAELQDLT